MRFSPKVGHTQGRELSGKRQKAGPAPSRAQRFLSGKQGDYLSQRKCVQRARPRPIHETSSCSARSGDGAGNHFIYDAKSHAPRRGMTPNPDPNRKIRIPKPNQPPKHCRIRDPNLLQNPRPNPAEFGSSGLEFCGLNRSSRPLSFSLISEISESPPLVMHRRMRSPGIPFRVPRQLGAIAITSYKPT